MNKTRSEKRRRSLSSLTAMLASGVLIFTSSCTTTKNAAGAPAAATEQNDGAVTFSQGEWWKRFGDPELNRLIKSAMKNNVDLANSVARIRIAEQSVAGARRGQLPAFSAAASAELGKQGSGDVGISTEQYGGGLQTSWELDLWGKLSSKTQAQLNELQASQAQLQASRLALAANLTRAYVRLCLFDDQIQLHAASTARNNEILIIYQKRHEAGRGTEEEVRYQEAELWRLQGESEELQRQRALEVNVIAELLARGPSELTLPPSPMRKTLSLIPAPSEIQAQSYESRPDFIAAEAGVRKALNLRESARAARLPRITIGTNVSALSIPSSPTAWAAMILPQISFPALDPQTKINLKVKEIEVEIAQNEYRKAVNAALKETADALNNHRSHQRQSLSAERRLEQLRKAHEATKLRFEKGRIARLEVLDSERQLISAEQSVLSQYAALLQDSVALFSSLGGDF